MPHAKFTTRWVKTVKPPQSGQVDYIDQKNARFTLRVTANGIKTWTTLYRFHGRRRRFVLGRFPSVSLSEAKKRAFAVFAQVSADVDPAAIREQHARDGTFHELQKQFVLHAQTKKNWKQDVWVINRHLLPRWKHIKARDIAAADVLAVFDSLRERPVLANRVLALVSRIFTFAIGRQWRPDNPAGRIKKHPEPGRDRVLSEDEIRAIWNALNTEDPLHEAIFKLRFLTAARGCEIRTMRWEDVSFQSGWWTIPRERAKNGVAHRVPLLPDTVYASLSVQPACVESYPPFAVTRSLKRAAPTPLRPLAQKSRDASAITDHAKTAWFIVFFRVVDQTGVEPVTS